MKRILFLGAPIFQIPIVNKAKEMGLYVGIVDIKHDAPAKKYANESFEASLLDDKKILDIARKFEANGIICGACDTSVVTCAKVCEKMNLPGNSLEVAINSTDKLKMLEAFKRYNVPHPRYQFIAREQVNKFFLEIPYPVVIKPVDSAGGRGINFVNNALELHKKAMDSSKEGRSGNILIEEYMDGPEVSVEVVVLNGLPHILQITDKITSGQPYFYEIGHLQPSRFDKTVCDRIKDIASKACIAVGLYNSVAHVEIKITSTGPKLVELGARMGGDCITTHLLNASIEGVNMSEMAINISLGKYSNVLEYKNSGVCSAVSFIPSTYGVLKSIIYEKKLYGENIVEVVITAEIGRNYSIARDDTGRFGYVVAKGKTQEEAMNECKRIIESIKFEMEE